MNWSMTVGITGLSALLAIAFFAARILRYRTSARLGNSALESFSIARYTPMTRLASDEDFEFLAAQPGYRPEMGATFRRDRRRIFKMYLRELAGDFHALHAEARKMVADSPEQHADLVGVLMRQEIKFWIALGLVDLRLLVPAARLPRIDVRGLVAAVESVRLDVTRLQKTGFSPSAA